MMELSMLEGGGWALAGLALLAYLPLSGRGESVARSGIKGALCAGFLLAGWAGAAPVLVLFGLALSLLGDVALSRPGRAAFLYGLSAFAMAHLVYILGFSALGGDPIEAFSQAPIWAVIVVAVALSTEVWLTPHSEGMAWPVRFYVLVIAVMALSALALEAPYRVVTLGAGLFMASDLILAVQRFRMGQSPGWAQALAGWALWLLYGAAQGAILWGALGRGLP